MAQIGGIYRRIMKKEPAQQIVQQHGKRGYQQPEQRKKQTDLPHQVIGHFAVVPDTESELQVEDQSGDKFQSSDDQSGENDQ